MRPVKYIGKSIVDYIPNLFTIAVIILLMRYILMFCKYMAEQIKCGKLKIPGFYPEWAMSTYHILRFVLWAFTVAMIYPYLPGADSRVFQGISVLMGLLVSFGSSALISNFIAGFVITYMRPFVKGDLIKLNDTIGTVEEKTALVIRIKTKKNEVVTIPNSFMMSAQTTNYSESARSYGLIIHQEISIGYDTPWKKVEQLMIDAALSTDGVSQKPRPFVLQTSLEDYAIVYQINAYITEAERMPSLTSELLANIQDKFATAGVEIMSPEYVSVRNGNKSTIPNEDQQAVKAETQKA
jgi:small-conductance mechanosensitive channel